MKNQNEKTIIQGKFSNVNTLSVIFGIFSLIGITVGFVLVNEYTHLGRYADERHIIGMIIAFGLSAFFIAAAIISYQVMNNCEIIVTNKKVTGKIKFGQRVDLPIHQISSVGQGWFKSLSVATSSGTIRFWLLKNRKEIFTAISDLLNPPQNQTQIINHSSTADELKKYKDLLDNGAITQQEYNEKKKQLLDL